MLWATNWTSASSFIKPSPNLGDDGKEDYWHVLCRKVSWNRAAYPFQRLLALQQTNLLFHSLWGWDIRRLLSPHGKTVIEFAQLETYHAGTRWPCRELLELSIVWFERTSHRGIHFRCPGSVHCSQRHLPHAVVAILQNNLQDVWSLISRTEYRNILVWDVSYWLLPRHHKHLPLGRLYIWF